MANDIDFEEIKKEYVSGSGSLRELAEKFGITYSSIANRSKKDGWVMHRFLKTNKTVLVNLRKIITGT